LENFPTKCFNSRRRVWFKFNCYFCRRPFPGVYWPNLFLDQVLRGKCQIIDIEFANAVKCEIQETCPISANKLISGFTSFLYFYFVPSKVRRPRQIKWPLKISHTPTLYNPTTSSFPHKNELFLQLQYATK
jgi:hypothetical protein